MKLRDLAITAGLYIAVCIGALASQNDDFNDHNIEIQAPLQAQDNTTSPPTIKVLGLTIAVVSVSDDGAGHRSRKQGSDDGNTPTTPVTLIPVTVGLLVKVELTGDAQPLTARSFKEVGGYETRVKVKGPLQAVDSAAKTITVLGLKIDISAAQVEGENDDRSASTLVTADSLAVGQNVEAYLDSTKLPALVATKLEVNNFSNQVALHIENEHGEIEHENEAIHVEVEQKITVLDDNGKKVKKTIHLETETHDGTVNLSGLAPGKARVSMTRHGKTIRKNVTVGANASSSLKLKVKG